MSTNLLLRRRAMMAANSVSGGGGGGTIIINVVTTFLEDPIAEGYLEFSQPCPYDLSLSVHIKSGFTSNIYVDKGENYIDFQVDFYPESMGVVCIKDIDPFNLNYRIIPTHIYAEQITSSRYNVPMGIYLYLSNIDYLPIQEGLELNAELCPIIKMGPIDNSDGDRYVWYSYDGEILIRDTYSHHTYALNSSGVLYQYT